MNTAVKSILKLDEEKRTFDVRVEILLSTYNGEKYLKEQLDSLLRQDGIENIKISIRDDGSTDNTCEILKVYEERYNFNVTYGINIGVNASMTELLKNADETFDFFAFCDQDDVWNDNRVSVAISALKRRSNEKPLLWGCMEQLSDENLHAISMMPIPEHLGNFYNAIVQNKLYGHTQIFNKPMRNLILRVPANVIYMYDWIAYILASTFGEVLYENRCLGKYRQHGDNAIGCELKRFSLMKKRLKRLLTNDYKRVSIQMACIYEIFYNKLNEGQQKELRRFLNSRQNFFKRLLYIFITKIKRNTYLESLEFRILYLFNFY